MKSTPNLTAVVALPNLTRDETSDRIRLRLKPHGPPAGFVDGAWWPRSRDLTKELPKMVRALASSWLPPSRITFAMQAWDPAPRRLTVDGRIIRLGGFRFQDEHLLDVLGPDGQRLTLLVIPPESGEDEGEQALRLAADVDNRESADELLSHGAIPSGLPEPTSVDAWESEGGSVHHGRQAASTGSWAGDRS